MLPNHQTHKAHLSKRFSTIWGYYMPCDVIFYGNSMNVELGMQLAIWFLYIVSYITLCCRKTKLKFFPIRNVSTGLNIFTSLQFSSTYTEYNKQELIFRLSHLTFQHANHWNVLCYSTHEWWICINWHWILYVCFAR